MATAQTVLDRVGETAYKNALKRWLPRLSHSIVNGDQPAPVYEYNCDVLKGLIWLCALLKDDSLCAVLADACIKCFDATSFGQIAPAAGNACILVLKQMPGSEPQQQLERLKLCIKNKTAIKLIGPEINSVANAKPAAVPRAAGPLTPKVVHARMEDLQEYIPRIGYSEESGERYHINNGKLYSGGYEVAAGVDIPSFRAFRGGYGKDRKHCYFGAGRLMSANPDTFEPVNFTWVTDRRKVWCLSGPVAGADAETFEACDDGHCPSIDRVPYSYGKDQYKVFHYDFDGKACWVRKADPASFEAVVTGEFGRDAYFVFCGMSVIARARRDHWQYLGTYYSNDDRRVFYFNRVVEGADVESFQVPPRARISGFPQARDRQRFYRWDREISREEYEEELAKYS